MVTAVARPRLGILRRVLDLALHDPRVDARALEPRADPLGPRRTARHLPVAEELGDSTGLQVLADGAHEVGDDRVTGGAAVAILVQRHLARARRDDEGRIADDELKALSRNGIEHRSGAQVPVDLVEGGVESGEGQRALGEVGGDDGVGVRAEVEGLHAAAGADVERGTHGPANRPRRQGRRGPTDPEDVVVAHRRPGRDLGQVGGDPPVTVVGGIRAHVDAGDDAVTLLVDEAERDCTLRAQGGQGAVDLGHVHRVAQREEANEGGNRGG